MPEQEPMPTVPTTAEPASGANEQTAVASVPNGVVPSFPNAEEAVQWKDIEPDHLAWRRELVELQLRQQQLDQWAGYVFRLLEYVIIVGFGVAFVWLGFYAVDHKASLQAVPLIGGGVAGLVSAVLAVRNNRQ